MVTTPEPNHHGPIGETIYNYIRQLINEVNNEVNNEVTNEVTVLIKIIITVKGSHSNNYYNPSILTLPPPTLPPHSSPPLQVGYSIPGPSPTSPT